MSFIGDGTAIEFQEFEIESALVAKLVDANGDEVVSNCGIKYKLTCEDSDGTWRMWEDLRQDLIVERGGDMLTSEVLFNTATGNLFVRFSNFDVDGLTRFTVAGVT
jgi:hypothetical protein